MNYNWIGSLPLDCGLVTQAMHLVLKELAPDNSTIFVHAYATFSLSDQSTQKEALTKEHHKGTRQTSSNNTGKGDGCSRKVH
eukprot:1799589-Amphidinium_carterae.1